MADITLDTTLFGAPGVSDPVLFHPGIDAIKRKLDFSVSPATHGTKYSLFGLPKAFVVTGVFLEETKRCCGIVSTSKVGGTVSLVAVNNTKTDADDKTILAATNVGATAGSPAVWTPVRKAVVTTKSVTISETATPFNDAIVLDEGDTVYLAVTLTGGTSGTSKMDSGELNVVIYGYTPYGDGLGNVVTPDYRVVAQLQQNVAGVDPWQNVAVRRGNA